MRNEVYSIFKTFDALAELVNDRTEYVKTGDKLKLKCNLAGYGKEDVKLRAENNVLTVTFSKSGEPEQKRRIVDLNAYATKFDMENVKATMTNGMLEIELSPVNAERAKEIRIN